MIPSAVAFVALGDVVAGAIYQTGKFTATDTRYVWSDSRGLRRWPARIDAGATLLLGFLRSEGHTNAAAFRDRSRDPDYGAWIHLRQGLAADAGLDQKWGAPGLTASAGVAAGWNTNFR